MTPVGWLPAGIYSSSPIVYFRNRDIFGTVPKSNFAEVCPPPLCAVDRSVWPREGGMDKWVGGGV